MVKQYQQYLFKAEWGDNSTQKVLEANIPKHTIIIVVLVMSNWERRRCLDFSQPQQAPVKNCPPGDQSAKEKLNVILLHKNSSNVTEHRYHLQYDPGGSAATCGSQTSGPLALHTTTHLRYWFHYKPLSDKCSF